MSLWLSTWNARYEYADVLVGWLVGRLLGCLLDMIGPNLVVIIIARVFKILEIIKYQNVLQYVQINHVHLKNNWLFLCQSSHLSTSAQAHTSRLHIHSFSKIHTYNSQVYALYTLSIPHVIILYYYYWLLPIQFSFFRFSFLFRRHNNVQLFDCSQKNIVPPKDILKALYICLCTYIYWISKMGNTWMFIVMTMETTRRGDERGGEWKKTWALFMLRKYAAMAVYTLFNRKQTTKNCCILMPEQHTLCRCVCV